MSERLEAYRAAPRELKGAAVVSLVQALYFLVFSLIGLFRQGLPTSSGPSALTLPGLAIGALLLETLFALPVTATMSRYPRRRHREAMVFQTALAALFGAGAIFGLSVLAAAYASTAIIVILLLSAASTRSFISRREQQFKAIPASKNWA